MHEHRLLRPICYVVSVLLLLIGVLCASAQAQSLPAPMERRAPAPASDCGCNGDAPIPVSSGMIAPFLPKIPNREFGFLYSFGKNVRTGGSLRSTRGRST